MPVPGGTRHKAVVLAGHKSNTNYGIGICLLLNLILAFGPADTITPSIAMLIRIVASVFYLWGCISYALGKGHSGFWCLVAIIPLLGLMILIALPDKHSGSKEPPKYGGVYALIILLLAGLGFAGWKAYHFVNPRSVEEAQQRAVKVFPALGVRDSPLNREFVARYQRYQATNKEYFNNPNWPLILAAESQAAISQSPSPGRK